MPQADILSSIEVEQRAGLAARLRHNEVVEGVVVRDDQILLHVHQLVHSGHLQLEEVLTQIVQAFGQKLVDGVALLHANLTAVARAVPVAEGDVDWLVLQPLLSFDPLLSQLFSTEMKKPLRNKC